MHKWILIWALAALLGACSSPIKLNEVDVEDKSGQAAAAAVASGGMKSVAPAMASGTADKKSSVAGLDMTKDGKSGSSSASGKSAGSAGRGSINVGSALEKELFAGMPGSATITPKLIACPKETGICNNCVAEFFYSIRGVIPPLPTRLFRRLGEG